MARKLYTEEEVLKALRNKNDILISGKTISILSEKVFNPQTKQLENNPFIKHDLGNSSWGKIDYLCKQLHYTLIKVDKF